MNKTETESETRSEEKKEMKARDIYKSDERQVGLHPGTRQSVVGLLLGKKRAGERCASVAMWQGQNGARMRELKIVLTRRPGIASRGGLG